MAKKLRDEDLVLNIIVNGDKGKKEIGQLERAIKDTTHELKLLEKQEKQLRAEGKKDTEQYKAVTAAIEQKNRAIVLASARMKELKQGLDLTRMSYVDLKQEMNRLARLRNIATPGTAEWKKHDAQLKIVKARYDQIQSEALKTGMTIKGMASSANRAIGQMTGVIASFIGVALGMRKATDEFVQFDDQIADVQKTTGRTRDEVLELNEALKDTTVIDTRTTQEGLLGLLRIAGKLGIEGKENLIGFTKAADEIAVSLTEDLGGDIEQSINTIGKLVDVFDVDEEFGIEESLRKTGSLINELGANSSATEMEVVDFISRLAGIGKTAKISIPNIAAFGSTLSQMKQSMEVGGTTFVNLIPKMFSDTATFARIAQMEVGEFTEILGTDANEALIRVLEGLKGNNEGMTEMIAKMGEMGLEGARAKNILTVMANNTDKLRKEQVLANEAFDEGTSILEEYNIKNTNVAAELDKSKKAVTNMWVELGEKLYPVIIQTNIGLAQLLKIVGVFIDFVKNNWKAIVVATSAIVAYNAVLLVTTGRVRQAIIAIKAFTLALRSNPLGLIVGVLTAAATAYALYTKKISAAEEAQNSLNDANEKANEAFSEEESKIKSLTALAKSKSLADWKRKEAIDELIKIAPEHLGHLSLENINTEMASKSLERYIQLKIDDAKAEQLRTKMMEISAERRKVVAQQEAADKLPVPTSGPGFLAVSMVRKQQDQDRAARLVQLTKVEKELTGELERIFSESAESRAKIQADLDKQIAEEKDAQRKKELEEIKKFQTKKALEEKEKLEESQSEYRAQVILESKSLIEQERMAYEDRLKQAGIFGKKRSQLTKQEVMVLDALEQQHLDNLSTLDATALKEGIDRKQAAFDKELTALRISQNEEFKQIKTLAQAKAALEGDLSAQALNQITTLKQAKEQVDKMYMRREEELQRQHLEDLMAQLRLVMESGDFQGINLSDKMLSAEEKEILEQRLEEIRLKLSQLGLGSSTDQIEAAAVSTGTKRDLFGFTQEDWDTMFDNLERGKLGLQDLEMVGNAIRDIGGKVAETWSAYNNFVKAGEDRQLMEFEKNSEYKKQILEDQLNSGKIEQETYNEEVKKLDGDLERQKAVFARNQAIRERNVSLLSAITNTAAAVTKNLATYPMPFGAIFAGLAAATGALQIATINRTPLPEIPGAEDGGFLDVRRSQDQKMFRAKSDPSKRGFIDKPTILVGEGNKREFVASNDAYNNPTIRPVLDAIDTAQRNGSISTVNLNKLIAKDRPAISLNGRESGGFVNESATTQSTSMAAAASDTRQLLSQTYQLLNKLNQQLSKPIKADVSLVGKNGFYEAEADYNEIQENVNL